MAINDKIRDKKLQYDINKEAAKNQHYHQVKLKNMLVEALKFKKQKNMKKTKSIEGVFS